MNVYNVEGRMILKAPLAYNKTFKVDVNMVDHQCLASTIVEDKNWLWHYRYGHLNIRGLYMCHTPKFVIHPHSIFLAYVKIICIHGPQFIQLNHAFNTPFIAFCIAQPLGQGSVIVYLIELS